MVQNSPIILGEDSTFLSKENLNDPSGFADAGFDKKTTKEIIELASEAWATILRSLPSSTFDLPKKIPLYMETASVHQEDPTGALIYRFDRKKAEYEKKEVGQTLSIKLLKYPLPEIRGMTLCFTPAMLEKFKDTIFGILIHEMFHLLTYPLIGTSTVLAEAFAERLTSELVRQKVSRELHHLPWNKEKFASTCGLRIDDFAEVQRNTAFRDMRTIHALNSLREFSYTEMWDVIHLLLSAASVSKFSPSSMDVLHAMKLVVGELKTKNVLNSVLVRPLQAGKQCFLCPFEKEIFTFCFDIQPNHQYLQTSVEDPLAWDKQQFLVTESSTQLTVIAEYNDGKSLSIDLVLQGEQQFSYQGFLSLFRKENPSFSNKGLQYLRVRVLGIETTL